MSDPPLENPVPKNMKRKKKGLIMINTGDGKGKTTAALGVAMRSAGNKMKVFMVQFIKGDWKYGELAAAEKLTPYLEIRPMGEGFTWNTQDRARDIVMTEKAWELGKEKMLTGDYDLVVFDEINYVMDYQYLDVKKVVDALKKKPPMVHVILTGRNAHPDIVALADLVTEMKEIKHPFKEGILAQKGIEF